MVRFSPHTEVRTRPYRFEFLALNKMGRHRTKAVSKVFALGPFQRSDFKDHKGPYCIVRTSAGGSAGGGEGAAGGGAQGPCQPARALAVLRDFKGP